MITARRPRSPPAARRCPAFRTGRPRLVAGTRPWRAWPTPGPVQVGDADDPEPAEMFLGLCVRPVGNQEVTTGLAHYGRRLRREHASVEHEHTSVLHLGVERGHVDAQPLKLLRGRLPVIDREQVLRHDRSLPFVIWGRSLAGPHSRYEVAIAESTLLLPRCQKTLRRLVASRRLVNALASVILGEPD
jgi:hypothetical protein